MCGGKKSSASEDLTPAYVAPPQVETSDGSGVVKGVMPWGGARNTSPDGMNLLTGKRRNSTSLGI